MCQMAHLRARRPISAEHPTGRETASQIALRLLVILPGALNSAETADQKRRNPSWSLEPACREQNEIEMIQT